MKNSHRCAVCAKGCALKPDMSVPRKQQTLVLSAPVFLVAVEKMWRSILDNACEVGLEDPSKPVRLWGSMSRWVLSNVSSIWCCAVL
jgi:hypothetical protein